MGQRHARFALAEHLVVQADHMVGVCGHSRQVVADHDLCESAFFADAPQKLAADQSALEIDPGIIKLARLLSGRDIKDPLLMRIIVSDLRNRNVLTRQILEENLKTFPEDPYLLEVAAEFELFDGNPACSRRSDGPPSSTVPPRRGPLFTGPSTASSLN
jgi:hypothetical protein